MNRLVGIAHQEMARVPRRRGDEPVAEENSAALAECSPQARG